MVPNANKERDLGKRSPEYGRKRRGMSREPDPVPESLSEFLPLYWQDLISGILSFPLFLNFIPSSLRESGAELDKLVPNLPTSIHGDLVAPFGSSHPLASALGG